MSCWMDYHEKNSAKQTSKWRLFRAFVPCRRFCISIIGRCLYVQVIFLREIPKIRNGFFYSELRLPCASFNIFDKKPKITYSIECEFPWLLIIPETVLLNVPKNNASYFKDFDLTFEKHLKILCKKLFRNIIMKLVQVCNINPALNINFNASYSTAASLLCGSAECSCLQRAPSTLVLQWVFEMINIEGRVCLKNCENDKWNLLIKLPIIFWKLEQFSSLSLKSRLWWLDNTSIFHNSCNINFTKIPRTYQCYIFNLLPAGSSSTWLHPCNIHTHTNSRYFVSYSDSLEFLLSAEIFPEHSSTLVFVGRSDVLQTFYCSVRYSRKSWNIFSWWFRCVREARKQKITSQPRSFINSMRA